AAFAHGGRRTRRRTVEKDMAVVDQLAGARSAPFGMKLVQAAVEACAGEVAGDGELDGGHAAL
ncbi:MAG: hypothetical protein P8127_17225, partial [Acidobacteriota bacterium]